jgi:hypothetical protein
MSDNGGPSSAVSSAPVGAWNVDTPVEDTPVEDTPVEDTPVEDTPVEDTPVEDTPVEDTPVEDAPCVDSTTVHVSWVNPTGTEAHFILGTHATGWTRTFHHGVHLVLLTAAAGIFTWGALNLGAAGHGTIKGLITKLGVGGKRK